MLGRTSSLGIVFAMLLSVAIGQQNTADIPIKANKEVQSFLQILSSTNLQERQELFPEGTTEEEYRAKLAELERMAGGMQELVVQLLYARAHAKTTSEAMMPIVVIEQLGISQDNQIAGVLPYLETSDKAVLKEASEWLEGIDYNRKTRNYEFGRHEDVIRQKKPDVPSGLVKYMYAKSPDAALSSLATVYLDKDEAKALVGQVKGEDKAQAVQRLSQRPEWWAHLYVAVMMEKYPSLRTPELVEKLETDTNPLVREKVSKLKDQLQPK